MTDLISSASNTISYFLLKIFTHNDINRSCIVITSIKLGTFFKIHFSSVKSDKAINGKHAFLEPLITTSPLSGLPPLMQILSIKLNNHNFGNVTPFCLIYFPERSKYDISQEDSPFKNKNWQAPSFA